MDGFGSSGSRWPREASGVLTVVALALAPAIALGIARFAYALVLPDMRADLGWSYAEAGRMTSANAAGYLIGASLAARAITAAGAFRVMTLEVATCVVALSLCGTFRHAVLLDGAWLLAGCGGAFAFVAGGVLATDVAERHPDRAAFLLGLFYAGPGLGILISGIGVPAILSHGGAGSWPTVWRALAVTALFLSLGLWFGRSDVIAGERRSRARTPIRPMASLLFGYFFFGAGYIAYMTFMVAWLKGQGALPTAPFWATIGLAAMASPWLWAGVLKSQLHGRSFGLLTLVTMAGAALPLLSTGIPALVLSAALFGSAFFAVVASTTVFVRRNFIPASRAVSIGALTVAFGLGQTLGPMITGLLGDLAGGLSTGLWFSVGLLFIGALLGATQRDLAIIPQP